MNKQSDGVTIFFLAMILLTVSGVPIMSVFGQAFGAAALFGGLLVATTFQYIALALLAFGAWRFFRWYAARVREEHRRLTAAEVRSMRPTRLGS
jgi:hypothetical protein